MKQKEYLEKVNAFLARIEKDGNTPELVAQIAALKAEGERVVSGGSRSRSEEELKFCLLSQFGDSSKENKKRIMAAIDAYYAGDKAGVLAALMETEYKGFARAKVTYETVANLYRDLAAAWGIDAPKFEKEVEVGKRMHKETGEAETAETETITDEVALPETGETETETVVETQTHKRRRSA